MYTLVNSYTIVQDRYAPHNTIEHARAKILVSALEYQSVMR